MEKKYTFERFYWLDSQIKAGKYPNRKDLADNFGITVRQAARDVEYMRDFLIAPIEYCPKQRGYYYSDISFELQRPRVTEKELIGLVMADCMADSIPDRKMLKDIDSFTKKVCQANGFDLDKMKKKISIKNIMYEKVDSLIFDSTLQAINSNQKIEILYKAQYKSGQTTRIVNPLHLIMYNGSWFLYAYCENRKDYRTFALSGICEVTFLNEFVNEYHRIKDVKKKIEESFGIFLPPDGPVNRNKVILRFRKNIADRIKKKIWIESQEMEETIDGSILLSFFVTDFTEISEEILKYGPNVEVIQPESLRGHIKKIISKMASIYQSTEE